MLKNKPIKYERETNKNNKRIITKNIRFDKVNADRINSIIRKYNEVNTVLKMNNDIFMNVVVSAYFEMFENNTAICDDLKKRALSLEGIQ